jgi:hypothetical protein
MSLAATVGSGNTVVSYAVAATSDLTSLWSGLKGLAACREYRDVCLFAGTRLVASLDPKSEDPKLTQLAVAKALPLFDPAPLGTLPVFSFQALRSAVASAAVASTSGGARTSAGRWQEIMTKLDKVAPVLANTPTSDRMRRDALPHLRAREPALKRHKLLR